MSIATPVDRVSEVLVGAGYIPLPTPIAIGGLKFDVPAAFLGSDPSPDVIVAVDTVSEDQNRLLRKIEGIARAMDLAGSKRPLTAVVLGPKPASSVLDAMSRVCRVLPVGTILDGDAEEKLGNWLAVLLPLRLPELGAGIANPLLELSGRVDDLDPEIADLVNTAGQGAQFVRARLAELISAPIEVDFEEAP